ncbi:hypothetical protein [Brevibacillus sp. SYSU BS000544]|uniref:hypothetical protein n=1 Tax=Brevibacillus sp. SYSU BS000544 TaxID=3416443 RepID=UPI003CE524C3
MDAIFGKEKHVLEIFYNRVVYSKDERGFQSHNSSKFHWPQTVKSNAGFVDQQTLFLPKKSTPIDIVDKCDLIIITDYHNEYSLPYGVSVKQRARINNHYLLAKHHQVNFGMLKFFVQDPLPIYLAYDIWDVGIPKRDNFLITTMSQDQKVRIRINGKNDCSMTSRRERTFTEQDFLIHYHGTVKGCMLADDKEVIKNKPILLENYRDIDLRKILY